MGRFISPNEIFGKISDSESRVPRIDASTHVLEVIDTGHHEVHDGVHFTYTYIDADFDIVDAKTILIITPNTTKWAHMIFEVESERDTNVKLYLNTAVAGHGSAGALTAYNNNGNSVTSNDTTLNDSDGAGADGTLIYETQFGLSTGAGAHTLVGGGDGRAENEWVLKQNSKYLFVVTTGSDDSSLALRISWYEHTDKD